MQIDRTRFESLRQTPDEATLVALLDGLHDSERLVRVDGEGQATLYLAVFLESACDDEAYTLEFSGPARFVRSGRSDLEECVLSTYLPDEDGWFEPVCACPRLVGVTYDIAFVPARGTFVLHDHDAQEEITLPTDARAWQRFYNYCETEANWNIDDCVS